MKELLERKLAIKNRMDALSRELQPHLRAVENLRDRIDVLENDYRYVLDKIREEGIKHEQAAA
jgi:phage shock protein A